MRTLILGPTFLTRSTDPPDAVADRLERWLCAGGCPYAGERTGRHLQVSIPPARRHRWSPWLTIEIRDPDPEIDPDPSARAEAFGRFNPSPAIWTGYMLASLALITLMAAALTWGIAEMTMGNPPRALWGIPACVAVLVAMWSVSAVGQRLAHDDMGEMQRAVEALVRGGSLQETPQTTPQTATEPHPEGVPDAPPTKSHSESA